MIKTWILVLIMTYPFGDDGRFKRVEQFETERACKHRGINMMAFRMQALIAVGMGIFTISCVSRSSRKLLMNINSHKLREKLSRRKSRRML